MLNIYSRSDSIQRFGFCSLHFDDKSSLFFFFPPSPPLPVRAAVSIFNGHIIDFDSFVFFILYCFRLSMKCYYELVSITLAIVLNRFCRRQSFQFSVQLPGKVASTVFRTNYMKSIIGTIKSLWATFHWSYLFLHRFCFVWMRSPCQMSGFVFIILSLSCSPEFFNRSNINTVTYFCFSKFLVPIFSFQWPIRRRRKKNVIRSFKFTAFGKGKKSCYSSSLVHWNSIQSIYVD